MISSPNQGLWFDHEEFDGSVPVHHSMAEGRFQHLSRASANPRLGLGAMYARRGMPGEVNGVPVRFAPEHRWYFTPRYDSSVADYFRPRVRPGSVCLSVGLNLGVYPLQFAHWSGPGGVVYAFEPSPDTAAVLRRQIAMNRLAGRVEVVERAISDRPGTATFHLGDAQR
jgi:hypothetical protein